MAFILIHIISAHSLAWIENYYLYLCIRVIVGATVHAVFAISSIIVLELVPIDNRTFAMCIFQIGWKIGLGILTLLAYFIRSEKYLQVRRKNGFSNSNL